MKYNLGKFNRKGSQASAITGSSTIEVNSNIDDVKIKLFAKGLTSSLNMDAIAIGLLYKYFKGLTEFELNTNSNATLKLFNINILTSDIELQAEALGSNIGEEFIALEDIRLRPGEEMVINTCDLTATINGENAISSLTVGSDFFDFLAGENDVIISGENSNGLTVDVYWKDRWL